ncbi:MAG: TrbC/VirB2 family protein [Alphaproteobacteria bacterium]|nr:TrbC/VirB2 family protein [Alphaproteobacteria bacterium]
MTVEAMANSITPKQTSQKQAFLTIWTAVLLLMFIQSAYAATNTPMGDVLCEIVYMVYGNLGRGLATLAVVIIGVGATLGKTSWGLAMTVAIGISVVFNAEYVVTKLMNSGSGTIVCDYVVP